MDALFLVSWLAGPVLMLAVAFGCGLLVRRLTGGGLPAVLVLPVGFAALVAEAAFLTTWNATAKLAGPGFVVLAVLGFVLERRSIRVWLTAGRPGVRWSWAWPAGAAAFAFVVVAAPVLLTGHVGYTGYEHIVDLGQEFQFTNWFVTHGRMRPPDRVFSYHEVATKTLDFGYPDGAQAAEGSFARLLGVAVPWAWQPYVAFAAGMLALAGYAVLEGAVTSRVVRTAGAAIAAVPTILYAYTLTDGIKEITSVALLVVAAALIPSTVTAVRQGRLRGVLPLGLAVGAALATLSLTLVPWLGPMLAGAAVVALAPRGPRLRALSGLVAAGAVTLIVALPTVWLAITKLGPAAVHAQGANRTVISDLGNLAAPIPVREVAGVWLSGDYRVPSLGNTPLSNALIVVVVVLAVVGLVSVIRRRRWGLVLLALASGVALVYFVHRTGPWIQFKAITISAPTTLLLATAGVAALVRRPARQARRRAGRLALGGVGALAAAAVAAGVLGGNALAYHDTPLSPTDRLRDLEGLGERVHGGPALYPAWDEAAEFFLRRQRATAMPDGFLQVRPEAAAAKPGAQFAWDPDDLVPSYVQSYDLIVLRRGPLWSRPPSNFRLVEQTRYHEVWRKVAPTRQVVLHVPLPGYTKAEGRAACSQLVSRARALRTRGIPGHLAYVAQPVASVFDLSQAPLRPAAWQLNGPAMVNVAGPGLLSGPMGFAGGEYQVWLGGAISRPFAVRIDGRPVGQLENQWSYPGQSTLLATVRLSPGVHRVELVRGGGSLAPANGASDQPIGPVTFVKLPRSRNAVATAPLSVARSLCRRRQSLDWIEIVRGS